MCSRKRFGYYAACATMTENLRQVFWRCDKCPWTNAQPGDHAVPRDYALRLADIHLKHTGHTTTISETR